MNLKALFEKARVVISDIEPSNQDLRLEEAEKIAGDYNVVVSYLVEDKNPSVSPTLLPFNGKLKYERIFKKLIFSDDMEFKKVLIFKP